MEKKEPIIDRALYKKIKSMDRETMNNFVQNVYQQGYKAAESPSIDYDKLRADLSQIKGIGESRLNEIMSVIDKHIELVNDEYDGINATIVSPEGQAFEVQIHTLESFNLKNGQLHRLYEQCRVLSPSAPLVAQLNDEMFALSESLEKPLNINEVLNK